jgi:competence protein ComEA
VESLKKTIELLRARDPKTLRKVLVFAAAAGLSVWVLLSSLGPAEQGKAATSSTTISQAELYVDIVGAVVRPGVYPVTPGTRLFEVVSSAGGFTKNADQKSVNLARLVTDGEQIVVLGSGSAQREQTASKLLSLNAATELQLEGLPGVGPTLAGRIIDWRTANGGFTKVDQLLKVGGIGDKLFAGLRNMVQP